MTPRALRSWFQGCLATLATALALLASDRACAQADKKADGAPAKPLASYFPREDLFFLLEFDGLKAHQAAWEKSAAYKVLTDARLGPLLEDQFVQGLDRMVELSPFSGAGSGRAYVDIVKNAFKDGFAFGLWGKQASQARFALVVRKADRPELRKLLTTIENMMAGQPAEKNVEEKPDVRVVHEWSPMSVWWSENGDIVFTGKDDVEALSGVIDGARENAVDHPRRKTMLAASTDFETMMRVFLDVKSLPRSSETEGNALLEGVELLEGRWGFQNQAIVTQLRIVAPAPRKGILALFDQPRFSTADLKQLPAGATNFTAIAVDLAKSLGIWLENLKDDPRNLESSQKALAAFKERFSVDLQKDVLGHLGPRIMVETHKVGGQADNIATMVASRYSGVTLAIEVRDHDAVATSLESISKVVIAAIEGDAAAPGAPRLTIKKEAGDLPTYVAVIPPEVLPPPIGDFFQPTIILGKDRLIVGASKKAAETAAKSPGQWNPAVLGAHAAALPNSMTYLAAGDLREITPILTAAIPLLIDYLNGQIKTIYAQMGRQVKDQPIELKPEMVPTAKALNAFLFPSTTSALIDRNGIVIDQREPLPTAASLIIDAPFLLIALPAVSTGRGAARRAQCVNNMKQIGLAFHNHHSSKNVFPSSIRDKDGKPLLSWRVAILPYIEQQELYNKFHLDEPWDSEHNKELIKEMPQVYICPQRTKADDFTTTYRIFVDEGALFDTKGDVGLQSVTDGTSNTLMVVEAKDSVIWTKPEELKFDPNSNGMQGLASQHPGGFNVLFADGSVRFIKTSISKQVLKALITRAGGEVISADSY